MALPGHEARPSGRWLYEQITTAEDLGHFGPESTIWGLHREAVLALGLGRALLLQLAHPWVAQAVVDHSTFQNQPVERLFATVATAELLVFGGRRQADAAAAHVRHVHSRITGSLSEDVGRWRKGTRYRAGDPDALLWVLASLIDTTLVVYEACFGALPEHTANAYLADAARLGAMIELPPERVPRDRRSLEEYMRAVVADGTVAVGSHARNLAGEILRPRLPIWARVFWLPYKAAGRAMTVALMPEPLRAQYGSVLAMRRPWAYRAGGMAGRALLHRLPRKLRLDPIASTAIDRANQRAA